MEAKALIKYLRIGPRKVRPVINLIRKKRVGDAFRVLKSVNKKGARLTEEALKSAVANARVKKMEEAALIISDIRADGGPVLKRFIPRSMGRANRILKRTTHLQVVVREHDGIKKRLEQLRQAEKGTKKSARKSPAKEKKAARKKSDSKKAATK